MHRLVVAFAVFSEIRDAMLCEIALRFLIKATRSPLQLEICHRRPEFCAVLHFSSQMWFIQSGACIERWRTVTDVCLNTVAVLFLLEVDNPWLSARSSERQRMEAEEMAGTRQVADDELRTMDAVKIVSWSAASLSWFSPASLATTSRTIL